VSDAIAEAATRLRAAGVDNPRLDARLLWEFAQRTAHPRGEGGALFQSLIARRAAREPLAYITGRKEFWSLDVAVGPGCLIPRPDTETLIEELTRLVPDHAAPLSILDLGTGSGCILLAALRSSRTRTASASMPRRMRCTGRPATSPPTSSRPAPA